MGSLLCVPKRKQGSRNTVDGKEGYRDLKYPKTSDIEEKSKDELVASLGRYQLGMGSTPAAGDPVRKSSGEVISCSSDKEWEQYKNKEQVLAFFTVPWSAQSNEISRTVQDLAREYSEVCVLQLDMSKLDMMKFENIPKDMSVNLPGFMFMKNGIPVPDPEGILKKCTDPEQLKNLMNKIFQKK